MSSDDTALAETSDAFAVEVDGVTVVRGQTRVLDDVSCRLPRGRCTALLGPNGCGKTSLTRCLTGQMLMTAGTVRVLGEVIGRTDVRALRRRIGIVNPTVDGWGNHVSGAVVDAELTAREAVLTGFFGTVGLYDAPTRAQRERADGLLVQVGLASRRDQRLQVLSTGERRRALIARALTNHPRLLILDEPTAGLDVRGREQVLATIEAVLASADPPTVLMITHHVEEVSPRTVQVLLMKQGRMVSAGTPDQAITPESLTALFDCRTFVRRVHGRYWLEVLPEAWPELMRQAQAGA